MADDATTKYQIDGLLDCDKGNIEQTRQALLDIHKDSLRAVDECADLFHRIGVLYGESGEFDKHNPTVQRWFKGKGGDPEQNLTSLRQAKLIGTVEGADLDAEAKAALERIDSVMARTYLLLRLGRDFLFGVTDLLRLRITSIHGYIRIQTESAAIIALSGAKDCGEFGTDWLHAYDSENGIKFYRKYHHSRILPKLKDLGLYDRFNSGSNIALHSRIGGVLGGIVSGQKNAKPGEIRLLYQEETSAVVIFYWFSFYLQAHQDILHALPKALPEVDFGGVDLRPFAEMVKGIWATAQPLYEHEMEQRA